MIDLILEDQRVFAELETDECLVLLRRATVGRIALSVEGDAPLVLPVSFVVAGDMALFHTTARAAQLFAGARMSLQIDDVDPHRHSGASVLVRGRARVIDDTELAELVPEAWAPGERDVLIAIPFDVLTGRRIEVRLPELDPRGYR